MSFWLALIIDFFLLPNKKAYLFKILFLVFELILLSDAFLAFSPIKSHIFFHFIPPLYHLYELLLI